MKIVGDTCVEGDLKVTGVLKNGADKPYLLVEDHEQGVTDITSILDDIVNAIQLMKMVTMKYQQGKHSLITVK